MEASHSLSVWNRACGLAVKVYDLTRDCQDGVFREQLTDTSISLAAQIAAGYERSSPRHFAQYLEQARSRCAELRTQLYLAAQIDLITLQCSTELMQESLEISRALQALIGWCEAQAEGPGRLRVQVREPG